jgi:hypothetical protein
MIAKASETVRQRLMKENPQFAGAARASVAAATNDMHSRFGPGSKRFYAARQEITRLNAAGALSEDTIVEYATRGGFEEVVVCLSLLGSIPAHLVERVLTSREVEMICIMTRALELPWRVARSLLLLVAPDRQMPLELLEKTEKSFADMNPKLCKAIFASYRKRR